MWSHAAAPHHVGGEAAAVERRREVVEEHFDALDALVGRAQDVAEGEHAGVIDQHVHVDALRTRALEESCDASRRARSMASVRTSTRGWSARISAAARSEPLRREPRHEDVGSGAPRAARIAASDAASGARHEGPAAAARSFRVACQGSFASSMGEVGDLRPAVLAALLCPPNTCARCSSCGGRSRCGSRRRPPATSHESRVVHQRTGHLHRSKPASRARSMPLAAHQTAHVPAGTSASARKRLASFQEATPAQIRNFDGSPRRPEPADEAAQPLCRIVAHGVDGSAPHDGHRRRSSRIRPCELDATYRRSARSRGPIPEALRNPDAALGSRNYMLYATSTAVPVRCGASITSSRHMRMKRMRFLERARRTRRGAGWCRPGRQELRNESYPWPACTSTLSKPASCAVCTARRSRAPRRRSRCAACRARGCRRRG